MAVRKSKPAARSPWTSVLTLGLPVLLLGAALAAVMLGKRSPDAPDAPKASAPSFAQSSVSTSKSSAAAPSAETASAPASVQPIAESASAAGPSTGASSVWAQDTPEEEAQAPADEVQRKHPRREYHARSGRSPMPQPGENLRRPLPFTRLVDEEPAPSMPTPDGVVAWDQAEKYLGQTITVQGKVVVARHSGNVCFLNFTTNWRGKFYVIIFEDPLKQLPQDVEAHFKNQIIRVRGQVTEHRGSPQIQVSDVKQIEIVKP